MENDAKCRAGENSSIVYFHGEGVLGGVKSFNCTPIR